MTPKELIKLLKILIKVHPDAANHTVWAHYNFEPHNHLTQFSLNLVRYDQKRKRIVLEDR